MRGVPMGFDLHVTPGELPDRARIAFGPASGLNAGDEVANHFVEQGGLFLVHNVEEMCPALAPVDWLRRCDVPTLL